MLKSCVPDEAACFLDLIGIDQDTPRDHEFLPKSEDELAEVAKAMGADPERLRDRALALEEFNPMLGHRGCRLLVSYPEIAEMQARAIFEAAVQAARDTGAPVVPEIMA